MKEVEKRSGRRGGPGLREEAGLSGSAAPTPQVRFNSREGGGGGGEAAPLLCGAHTHTHSHTLKHSHALLSLLAALLTLVQHQRQSRTASPAHPVWFCSGPLGRRSTPGPPDPRHPGPPDPRTLRTLLHPGLRSAPPRWLLPAERVFVILMPADLR